MLTEKLYYNSSIKITAVNIIAVNIIVVVLDADLLWF